MFKNTTRCPWPGLEPGPFAPESSALTMRSPRSLVRGIGNQFSFSAAVKDTSKMWRELGRSDHYIKRYGSTRVSGVLEEVSECE